MRPQASYPPVERRLHLRLRTINQKKCFDVISCKLSPTAGKKHILMNLRGFLHNFIFPKLETVHSKLT